MTDVVPTSSAPDELRRWWACAPRWMLAPMAALDALFFVIWLLSGPLDGELYYFWPIWPWISLCLPVAVVTSIRWSSGRRYRVLSIQVACSIALSLYLVLVWAVTGANYFWPAWSMLGLTVAAGVHAWIRIPTGERRHQQLEQRVDVLTKTRRDVMEFQASELRRVERDLHDGAQARLVALGMHLGLAEELLRVDPEGAAKLLSEARGSAGEALADLRDLVRGICPPILADRGLVGAVKALAVSMPIPVTVEAAEPLPKMDSAVESSLYFAASELLANVVKHSHASTAWVRFGTEDARLTMVVGDNGKGGAIVGEGSGLPGIQRRIAAFDGVLSVVSPVGGPSISRVDVPCGP